MEQLSVASKHYKYLYLKQVVLNVMKRVNENQRKEDKLQSLWERIGVPASIGAFADYTVDEEDGIDKLKHVWRTYMVDESGKRSLFRGMDKIKLIYSRIGRQIKLGHLQKHNMIVAHFALHDYWELNEFASSDIEMKPRRSQPCSEQEQNDQHILQSL